MSNIQKLGNYELIRYYRDALRAAHYSPCGDCSNIEFTEDELYDEILRRMYAGDIDNRTWEEKYH